MYDLMETARKASYEIYKIHTELDFQEVVSEAYLNMMEALNTWNPEKGRSKNSWVAFIVKRELWRSLDFSQELTNFDEISDIISFQSSDPNTMNPELLMIVNETIGSFTETSKEIIRAIFEEKIKPETYNKNAVTREIKSYLRSKGFPWWKIQAAFKELRQYANNLA
jgi:hypothetical protein